MRRRVRLFGVPYLIAGLGPLLIFIRPILEALFPPSLSFLSFFHSFFPSLSFSFYLFPMTNDVLDGRLGKKGKGKTGEKFHPGPASRYFYLVYSV